MLSNITQLSDILILLVNGSESSEPEDHGGGFF